MWNVKFAVYVVLLATMFLDAAKAQTLPKIRAAYTSIGIQFDPVYIMKELDLPRKNGVDAEVLFVPVSSRAIQAALAGEIQFITSGGVANIKVFQTGWNSSLPFGPALKAMFEEPYTLLAAFIGSTMLTMATHGTDQDMVQRMLTAPDYHKSRLSLVLSGVMDLPIAGAFLTVGILLSVFYAVVPGKACSRVSDDIEMPTISTGAVSLRMPITVSWTVLPVCLSRTCTGIGSKPSS